MNTVSNFGRQEKYFFFRVGRCAPTGSGELWCATENGEYAYLIYEKINNICERESEKRRAHGTRLYVFHVLYFFSFLNFSSIHIFLLVVYE